MKKITGLLLACLLPLLAHGQTVYNQFGPATGILKGQTSTPITSAATAADIVALWASCSTNEYLNQSGTCSLIDIAASVTGTLPVANGGTNLTGATDDHAMVGNGTTWQSKALTDCNASDSAVTYDTATNVWGCNTISGGGTGANPTGTVGLSAVNGSALTFLRSDGAPALSQSITPTWTGVHNWDVSGVNAVFNRASGFDLLRLDIAGIARGYIGGDGGGVGLFTGSAATGGGVYAASSSTALYASGLVRATVAALPATLTLTANDTVGDNYILFQDSAAAGMGYIGFGGSSTDNMYIFNDSNAPLEFYTNGVQRAVIGASGGITVASPTGGNQGDGTINATGLYINGVPVSGGATTTGSFTGTMTGFSGSVSCTVKYRVTGAIVYVYTTTALCQGTSNASTMTMTGLPVGIRPARGVTCVVPSTLDNGAVVLASIDIGGGVTAGTIQFNRYADQGAGGIQGFPSGWTASGTKGIGSNWACQYDLDS